MGLGWDRHRLALAYLREIQVNLVREQVGSISCYTTLRIQRRYSASDGSRVTSDDEECGPTSSSRPWRAEHLLHRGGDEQAGLRWVVISSSGNDPSCTGTLWERLVNEHAAVRVPAGLREFARLTGSGRRHPRACQYRVFTRTRQMWRRCRRARDPTRKSPGRDRSAVPAELQLSLTIDSNR